jgi:hypothetical protein
MRDAEIHRIKGYTSDGNLLIELEHSPDKIKKGDFFSK